MYFKKIVIENYGPFKKLDIDFRFDDQRNPIPLVLIGRNGSGKTILLSHIVNTLISAKQLSFEGSDVEKGKVYNLNSREFVTI